MHLLSRPNPETRLGLLTLLALSATGCVVGGDEPPTPLPVDAGADAQAYPNGPYGIDVGSVVSNFAFTGYVNPEEGIGPDYRVPISLGDFYNPAGDGTYPAESPFGEGEPQPKALVINVSALWCGPCQEEARNVLPGKYAEFKPLGAELLLNLADGIEPGVAGTFGDLDNWTTTFSVNYPSVIDPRYQLGALFPSSSFPANIIVDTKDMTIVEVVGSQPDEGFWMKLSDLLASG